MAAIHTSHTEQKRLLNRKGLFEAIGQLRDPQNALLVAVALVCLLLPIYPKFHEFVLVIGLLWGLAWWLSGRPSLGLKPLHLPLAVFFGWMALNILVASDLEGSWKDFTLWGRNFLVFLMFVHVVHTYRHLVILGIALALGHGFLGVWCVFEYLAGVDRVSGPGDYYPTMLGAHLTLAIPWVFCLCCCVKSANLRFLSGIVVLLLLFTLGANQTRAALLGLGVSSLILLAGLLWQGRTKMAGAWVLLAILLLVMPATLERMPLLSAEISGGYPDSRLLIWQQAFSIPENGLQWLIGIGQGRSFELATRSSSAAPFNAFFDGLGHAHSFLVHYLVTLGIAGLAAYGWLLVAFVGFILASLKRTSGGIARLVIIAALAALAGFVVMESFDYAVKSRNNMTFFWWTFAAAIVAGRLKSEREPHITFQGIRNRLKPSLERAIRFGLVVIGIFFVITAAFALLTGGTKTEIWGISISASSPFRYFLRGVLCLIALTIFFPGGSQKSGSSPLNTQP